MTCSFCLSVGRSGFPEKILEKMADLIEMPFRVIGRVISRNDVLDGGPGSPGEGANFGEMGPRHMNVDWATGPLLK